MERYSLREVIEQAVRTERLGYEFYTRMSKRFERNIDLQKLFKKLAEKEIEHEKTFSALKDTIEDEEPEGWEDVSEYLRAIVESEFFLGKSKSLPNLAAVTTVKKAVKFALGFEKETLLYYYAIRDTIKGEEKKIVEKIISEEKSHIRWLSGVKSSVK